MHRLLAHMCSKNPNNRFEETIDSAMHHHGAHSTLFFEDCLQQVPSIGMGGNVQSTLQEDEDMTKSKRDRQ